MSTGAELRNRGHQQVAFTFGAAGEFWHVNARRFIEALAPGDLVDADSIRAACGSPIHVNASGAVIRKAAVDGLLEIVGSKQSENPERRAGLIRIWRRT